MAVKAKYRKPKLTPRAISTLAHMADDEQRRAFLRSRLISPQAVLDLNAATQKELRVDTRTALSLAQAAVIAAGRLRKHALLAQCYRMKANVLAASGDYQAAVALYDQAIGLFENAKDAGGTARSLTAIIQPHIMLGDYDRAFAAAQKAQSIFVALGDTRRLARLENNIGNIYHRQDRFHEALTHYERAYRDLLPHGDLEELTISLNNMSMCLINLNDFARALATYEQAKELLREKDLPLIRLITDYNIAYLYYMRGDYRRAIDMLKSACAGGEKIGYTYLVALCYLDLSDIYVELNLSAEAQAAAEHGYLLFQKLHIGYEAAKTLANKAIVFGQEGQVRRALELFARAKPLFVRENNLVWPWLIDLYQAVILFHEGRDTEVRPLALGAARFFDSSTLKNKAALCHFLLAQVALRTKDFAKARGECLRALALLERVEAPNLRYQGHFLLGQIEHAHGNLPAAYDEYQLARHELEDLRSNLGREELKISFMKNKVELYERLVSLSLDRAFSGQSQQEAFSYMELAKSRSFTEQLSQRPFVPANAESTGKGPKSDRVRELREQLNWLRHRIESEQLRPEANSPATIAGLDREAQMCERALLKELEELAEQKPAFDTAVPNAHIPIEQIQSLLGDQAAILEYFFCSDTILVALLTKNSLHIHELGSVAKVSQTLRLLRFQLGRFQSQDGSDGTQRPATWKPTLAHLQSLYNDLIAPVRDQLRKRQLVVVPHGVLHYLPFHALHDGQNFLIDSFTVSYAPSSSLFALAHQPLEKRGHGTLIFGVPDERAPLIKVEVEGVHATLPGSRLFLNPDATHEAFLREAPYSQVIHVATHGVFRPDNPMFSGIRLSDTYLHLYELYHMHLSAELLTLSGCATGLNVVAAGDELLGLMRGLFYAGARSLVLSLWDVNDQSTAQFMTSFYRHLQDGAGAAQALTEAIQEVRKRYPNPYFWAPFVLVGKALRGNAL